MGSSESVRRYNKTLLVVFILATVLELSGILVLFWVDWRVALGVFLIWWALNMKKANKHYLTLADVYSDLLKDAKDR